MGERLSSPAEDILAALRTQQVGSLDRVIRTKNSAENLPITLADLLVGPEDVADTAISNTQNEAVKAAVMTSNLTEKQRQVIHLLWLDGGNERTFEQVGRILGCTPANVRLLKNRAFQRLREDPSIKKLHEV